MCQRLLKQTHPNMPTWDWVQPLCVCVCECVCLPAVALEPAVAAAGPGAEGGTGSVASAEE